MKVFLWGLPGSGKTTTGKYLATFLNLPFFDLDQVIEEKSSLSIPEIFQGFDENYFRELERESLGDVLVKPDFVLSTGGGTPCFFDNGSRMNQNGLTIFLDTLLSIIESRLTSEVEKRPLLNDKEKWRANLQSLYASRVNDYNKALIKIKVREETPEDLALIIKRKLEEESRRN